MPKAGLAKLPLIAWLSFVTLAVLAYRYKVILLPAKLAKYDFGHVARNSSRVSKRVRLAPLNKVKQYSVHTANSASEARGTRTAPSWNIFYNRLPKCGSRSLLNIVRRLSRRNNFSFAASTDFQHARPGAKGMLQELRKIANFEPPTFYNRHIHYLDFETHGYRKPVYINLIRDPIERFVSYYNYLKYGDNSGGIKENAKNPFRFNINECVMKGVGACDGSSYFATGKYFCGFADACKTASRTSVQLAKKHIDEAYTVIGTTEEFENSVRLFEIVLPEYFSGALDDWIEHLETKNNTATHRMDALSEEARKRLRNRDMVHEYEVYNHAKRKFNIMKKKYGIS